MKSVFLLAAAAFALAATPVWAGWGCSSCADCNWGHCAVGSGGCGCASRAPICCDHLWDGFCDQPHCGCGVSAGSSCGLKLCRPNWLGGRLFRGCDEGCDTGCSECAADAETPVTPTPAVPPAPAPQPTKMKDKNALRYSPWGTAR